MSTASFLWRRLDVPGHDACRLVQVRRGWRLEGVAAFVHDGRPAGLRYALDCDRAWLTRRCSLRGWLGHEPLHVTITRCGDGHWLLNRALITDQDDCMDLDLGFTPATNTLALRRIALGVGQSAELPVAWYDISEARLTRLGQRYERRSAGTYWYEAPRFNYSGLLRVNTHGFVESYPGLWESECPAAGAG